MLQLNRRRYDPGMRSVRGYHLFRRAHADAALDQIRRLADLVIGCVLLVITSPLMLLVALAIQWEGPGPILERQACIGRGGRRFQMLKFRTVLPDPAHTVPAWAGKPMRIGEFLQYSRIDSLPQLINVLRGEISIIDPDGSSPSFLE